ncbi:hypothetical protein BASA81_005801 [Batrachochytrium salamandrivorans]|nr:hypothetical protein BASA81_005801 [Batrachochytrium salamandrivorans]
MPLWIKLHEREDVDKLLGVLRGKQDPPDDMVVQISYWVGYGDKPAAWFLHNQTDEGTVFDKQWRVDAHKLIGSKGDAHLRLVVGAIKQCKLPLYLRVLYCNLHEPEIKLLANAVLGNSHILGLTVFGNPGNDSESAQRALRNVVVKRPQPLLVWDNQPLTAELMEERQRFKDKNQCVLA